MNAWSKDTILKKIKSDILYICKKDKEVQDNTDNYRQEFSSYLETLIEQIPDAPSGPLLPKTPKVPRKRVKRIETIPEDDVANGDSKASDTRAERTSYEDRNDEEDAAAARPSRRAASLRASSNIKKQQSKKLNVKERRPSTSEDDRSVRKPVRGSRAKRTISAAASSDEEEAKRPTKKRGSSNTRTQTNDDTIVIKIEPNQTYSIAKADEVDRPSRPSRNKRLREDSVEMAVRESSKNFREPAAKKANTVEDTANIPDADLTVESSMYEDAVGKTIPMNSTMNPNTTVTIDRKMMNATVVLESIQMPTIMNDTVTVKKSTSSCRSFGTDTLIGEEPQPKRAFQKSPLVTKSALQSKTVLQERMKALKATMANKDFSALITDDESSPERVDEKKTKWLVKPEPDANLRITRSSLISEDDIVAPTPPRTILREVNGAKTVKNAYKANTLFSPYTTDSVKKRVQAFEQAQLNSPKSVDVDAPTRMTRTKTRAMAAAQAIDKPLEKSIVQKVARETSRKSIAKAVKIALLKEKREIEERKENNIVNSAQKPNGLLSTNDKLLQKQQQRVTPIGKSRLQMPMSVNRIQHTPATAPLVNQNKAQTVSRSNIVMSVESFLPTKTLSKASSTDNLTEKKRKMNDEDARRKRDEALKAKIEEKKRKREEKELRNKLAREANEKLDMEKRLKVEKEREEKAKAAQYLLEKQREEAEKKRLIQLQRAQEKEERRRQEEQLRLQRLQEQEEAERQLAEQKRREQEAERRRQAEARAQHLAAAEAARMKAHIIAKAKLANKNGHDPMSYKLDSEPDDDDSDEESKPKNPIPYWAQSSIRKTRLRIDRFIPTPVVFTFFGAQKCTPDLTELFKGIKKERLQRTSSAIWKTPPRYSMMTNEKCA